MQSLPSSTNQTEQDGKRTLIKNQLYLIEQLQLENANLRNERDQLHLENEELKFQLQMISSSHILSQPSATFNNQQLEPLIENAPNGNSNNSSTNNHPRADAIGSGNSLPTSLRQGFAVGTPTKSVSNQVKILATPLRQSMKFNGERPQFVLGGGSGLRGYKNTTANGNGGGNCNSNRGSKNDGLSAAASGEALASAVSSLSLVSANNYGKKTPQQACAPVAISDSSLILLNGGPAGANIASGVTINGNRIESETALNRRSTSLTAPLADDGAAGGAANTATMTRQHDLVALLDSERNQHVDETDDCEQRRVKLVEQLYGDSEKVHAAAIIIQRAFRKYQICKRFRTITEQLRHTYQSSSSSSASTRANNIQTSSINHRATNSLKQRDPVVKQSIGIERALAISSKNTTTSNGSDAQANAHAPTTIATGQIAGLFYASGTTRAAALESLSYAASRLTSAAAASLSQAVAPYHNKPHHPQIPINGSVSKSVTNHQLSNNQHFQSRSTINNNQQSTDVASATTTPTSRHQMKQDAVVAAALNFQQLESMRKRQYRVGLNIFNKNPEKGVSFLIAHSFIDSTSPYTKNTAGYYHSNQLHYIDKHPLLQQQTFNLPQQHQQQVCQICFEEDNLKRNIAHFLLHRKGLAKEKIGLYLGNLQSKFNQDVLRYYLQELDFTGLQIDLALRKFLSTFRLPGEAQKIERIVDQFAQRYTQCQQIHSTNQNVTDQNIQTPDHRQHTIISTNNQIISNLTGYKNNLMLLSKDEIFILTFAIIMLNTDLHSPSLKPTSRMSSMQFVNNLRGVFKSQTINESDLIEIYERVKANQITTVPDHVTHVMKVQQGLTVTNSQKKELPNLCVPHRRLVCFCRLFEVYDVNKKEKVGQHQREIFLFNDLLLVTKLARRVRANAQQLYTHRHSIQLQGLNVQLFQSAHYSFGIRLFNRSNDETLIMFNARNELDQSKFVDDLTESIAEMVEMDRIRAHNIVESIHYKFLDRMRRHALLHDNATAIAEVNQTPNHADNIQQQSVNLPPDVISDCDSTLKGELTDVQQKQGLEGSIKTSHSEQPTTDDHIQTKFNSMMNLSSSSDNSDTKQTGSLRQNQSFAQKKGEHPSGPRLVDQSSAMRDQSLGTTPRRCSTGSAHSLDSGLFLSRDVSPNQSS